MKKLVIIILLFSTTICLGQLDPRPPLGVEVGKKKGPQYSKTSPLKVINLDRFKTPTSLPIRFIVDGKNFDQATLRTINAELIDSLKVVKGEHTFKGNQYGGEIHITMKKDYNYKPEFISLADLGRKYVPTHDKDMIDKIFFKDGTLLKGNYDKIMVDQKNILKIEFQRLHIKIKPRHRHKLNAVIVDIFTRSEENIKKANQMWIRGNENH